jgi:hypothetical protein
MKIGLWRYTSSIGEREAVVVADKVEDAYDALPHAIYWSLIALVEWIGESTNQDETVRVILDAPINI